MLKIRYTSRFRQDFKMVQKRGYDINLLEKVVAILRNEKPLPLQNYDHQLAGKYSGFRECHIAPDWLLIYKIEKDILVLSLTRTGSHSDLF